LAVRTIHYMKVATVASWHHALNDGDVGGVLRLTGADVEVRGPRGAARGHDVLAAWASGAGVSLEPARWFCGTGGEVVVAQIATWPAVDGGHTAPVAVATSFAIRDGLIVRIARHDELATALADSGLGPADGPRPPGGAWPGVLGSMDRMR
jgi:SnoaL-like protein